MTDLHAMPSVDKFLQTRQVAEMIMKYGRSLTLSSIRQVLAEIRENALLGNTIPHKSAILTKIQYNLESWLAPSLIPVINATGVILHTNLGRAPLSDNSLAAIQSNSSGYTTLEFELENGRRGSRNLHAEALLTRLTGAESALVVNNNAAAVLLILTVLARRLKVLISRTQLVEIGGGFRVPEVMRQSGAQLVEIGTTNRVNLSDYEQALQLEKIALVLRAHHSNFKIIGFTEEPPFEEIIHLSHQYHIPVVDDLGSGALIDTKRFGLAHEPTVQESLQAGADLVCFSGDKLLGGPQAGIIVGKLELIQKIRKHPLTRAVRADKLCLAALCETLVHYLKEEAEREIPIWQMISQTPEQIKARAGCWVEVTGKGKVIPGYSTVGGGSLPGELLPTFLYSLGGSNPIKFLAGLRKVHPPIIARVENDQVVLDPRTVFPKQEGALMVGLQNVISGFFD